MLTTTITCNSALSENNVNYESKLEMSKKEMKEEIIRLQLKVEKLEELKKHFYEFGDRNIGRTKVDNSK